MDLNPTKDDPGSNRKTNYEGAEAFDPETPEMGLYKLVINNLLEDTYYRGDEEAFWEVRQAFNYAADKNPEFVLKLASYARQEMYLRDISQALLVLSAYHEDTKPYVTVYADDIISRADEPATILGLWEWLRDHPEFEEEQSSTLPKPLKKAIGISMKKFDAYQLAKYDTDRRVNNLKDVLNMAHPHPDNEKQNELYRRLAYGELDNGQAWKEAWQYGEPVPTTDIDSLEPPETWEVIISEMGSTREAWENALHRMGLFARLRNLRNMLEAGVNPRLILNEPIKGRDYETGELFVIDEDGMSMDNVRNSKIYPFRFYSAYRALHTARIKAPEIERWLSNAIDASTSNISGELGSTFASADLSSSMTCGVSGRSNVQCKQISALFTAVLMKKGAVGSGFASDFKVVNAHVDTPVLELTDKILGQQVGGSTNGWKVIDYLIDQDISVDRIALLTDMQIWDSSGFDRSSTVKKSFEQYREEVNPETSLYMVDLSSYGDLVTPEGYEQVYNISGWNSQIIDFIQYAEEPGQVLDEVEAVERPTVETE